MLKNIFYKYLQSLLIFSIFVVVLYVVLQRFANSLISCNTPYLIVIFLIVTAITHYIIIKTDVERINYKPNSELDKEAQTKEMLRIERRFITRYMLATTVKLLSFLALLVLYVLFNRADIIPFSLNFMALYVLYSLFEVVNIRKPIREKH